MKTVRGIAAAVALGIALVVLYAYMHRQSQPPPAYATIYYANVDGSLGSWHVREDTASDLRSRAFSAAQQALDGPPGSADAVRFPAGTTVRSLIVTDAQARIDLSAAVNSTEGVVAESGEFKALVWTLTELPGISRVRVTVAGATVATLPGGHLELDEPLSRASW